MRINKSDIFTALQCDYKPLLWEETENFKADGFAMEQLSLAAKAAQEAFASPTPPLTYTLFNAHFLTGDRLAYQKPYYERRRRLLIFSLLAWQNPDSEKYTAALNDIAWDICSEAYWCLPAHFVAAGDIPLEPCEYSTQIDLFAAETGLALAEMLQLCGHLLSPLVSFMVKDNLEKRIFTPFTNASRFFRFEGMANNWSSVCAGAIGSAAMYMIKDTARLADILHRAMSCMEVYLNSFGDDGVCVEGVDYWSYGFGFFTVFADLLCKRTKGAIDLFNDAKVEAVARSQAIFYLGGGATVSFSDGGESGHFRMGLSCYLHRRYSSCPVPDISCAAPLLSDGCYRFCLGIRDILWYDKNARFGASALGMQYMQSAKWFVLQRKALALAAKGGHNGESHNHNDAGSFIVAKNGVQLLCDLGAGLYDAKYFSAERYDIFVNSSYSHNVPIINDKPQSFGAEFTCTGETATEDGFSLDICGCYADTTLQCAKRELQVKDDGHITISDNFTFSESGSIIEAFVTLGIIKLQGGRATFARRGEELQISYDEEKYDASIKTEEFLGHNNEVKTASILHLSTKTKSTNIGFYAEII